MDYIALIIVFIVFVLGCICGVVQNITTRRKSQKINIEMITSEANPCVISSEKLLRAGNVALIEERYDADLNAMMDSTFGDYERD